MKTTSQLKKTSFKKPPFEVWLEKQKTQKAKRVLNNLRKNPKLIGYGKGSWGELFEGKNSTMRMTFEEAILKGRNALRKAQNASKRKKKPKLKSISSLKKVLWKLVSDFIRERDNFKCKTCGRIGTGSQIHAGHFIPNASGGALLRYHPENIHAQCYHCNINLGGDGANYYRILELEHGQEMVKNLFNLKLHSIQADRYFYDSLIELYKNKNQHEIVMFLESYL